MSEVGGPAAKYLPRLRTEDDVQIWAKHGAAVLIELLNLDDVDRAELVAEGLAWVERFDADTAIEGYLSIYRQVVEWEHTHFAKNSED